MKWPFTGRNLLVQNQTENSRKSDDPKGILFSYWCVLTWNLFIFFATLGVKMFVLLKWRQKWRKSCRQVHTVNTRMETSVINFQEMNTFQLHGFKYSCTNPKCSRSSGPSASPCLSGTCWWKRCSGYKACGLASPHGFRGEAYKYPFVNWLFSAGSMETSRWSGWCPAWPCVSLGTKRWDGMHQWWVEGHETPLALQFHTQGF